MKPAFHAGERALQQRLGVAERMAEVGPRVIREGMPAQHRDFFAQLPFVVLGTVDGVGQPWASVLAGPPGFASTPDETTLRIQALPHASSPLASMLAEDAAVGMLGIEPHTRRRNRANGSVQSVDASGFTIGVDQSFGNCPKYIQARRPQYMGDGHMPGVPQHRAQLDAAALQTIRRADTLFIATAHPQHVAHQDRAHGVDVSHRGGRPGFVRVDTDQEGQQTLTIPDFSGNFFFNTLGNVQLHPFAGLLFVDFDTADLWQVAVQADLVWDGALLASFPGAQRLLRMRVLQVVHVPKALPLQWGPAELSPVLAGTGAWT